MLNSNSVKAIIRDLIFISLYSRQVETNGEEYTTFLSIRKETCALNFLKYVFDKYINSIEATFALNNNLSMLQYT